MQSFYQQHYPIWYAVHLSKPVAVTHVSPQKKLRPPTTIATWDITKNKYIRCQNPNHQQTSRVAKNNHAKIYTSTPRRQAIATSFAINITTCQKKQQLNLGYSTDNILRWDNLLDKKSISMLMPLKFPHNNKPLGQYC